MNARRNAARLLAIVLLASPAAGAGRAKLLDARWHPEAGIPAHSTVSEEAHTLTTEVAEPAGPIVAHAQLEFDVRRGNDGTLSFLSDHPWVHCEAPDGLIVGASGTVEVVCRAEREEVARIDRKTRVKLKVDPPGGGAHKNLFWLFVPAPR